MARGGSGAEGADCRNGGDILEGERGMNPAANVGGRKARSAREKSGTRSKTCATALCEPARGLRGAWLDEGTRADEEEGNAVADVGNPAGDGRNGRVDGGNGRSSGDRRQAPWRDRRRIGGCEHTRDIAKASRRSLVSDAIHRHVITQTHLRLHLQPRSCARRPRRANPN